MKKKILGLGGVLILGKLALAGSVGIGYGVSSNFIHNDVKSYPLPIVNLEYDKFFINGLDSHGLSIGYKLIEEDSYVLSLYGMPFGGYEIKNSDMDYGYKGIDDRDTQIMGGISLTYYPGYNLETKAAIEYGKEGGNLNLGVSRPYELTSKLSFIPSITYTFYDSDFSDYYFGLDADELGHRGGEKLTHTFSPDGSHRLGFNLMGNYRLNEYISLTGFTGVTKFYGDIADSPLVDNSVIYFVGTGLIYTF